MTDADTDALLSRLRAMLSREELRAGDRLGDERGLADRLGVPRTRLRVALGRLESEGLIRRTIGRGGGVVVADGRLERHLNTTEGLPDIARYQGIDVRTTVLRIELTLAGARDRRMLQLAEGAAVHRVSRLRFAAGTPLSLEVSALPAELFPGLASQDLSSLYRALRTVYQVEPVQSDETLELSAAAADQAVLLGVPEGTPLIRVERVAVSAAGRPIELAHEFFVGARIRFHSRKYGYAKVARAEHCNDPPEPTSTGTAPDGRRPTRGPTAPDVLNDEPRGTVPAPPGHSVPIPHRCTSMEAS
jgi:GntR family transcriptional regulator